MPVASVPSAETTGMSTCPCHPTQLLSIQRRRPRADLLAHLPKLRGLGYVRPASLVAERVPKLPIEPDRADVPRTDVQLGLFGFPASDVALDVLVQPPTVAAAADVGGN